MDLEFSIKEIGIKTALKFIKLYENKVKEARKELEEARTKIEKDYMAKIGRYNATSAEIRKLIEEEYVQCDVCEGNGYITVYEHMHDDRGHSLNCKACNGVGYIEKSHH